MATEYNNATHWVSKIIDLERPVNIQNPLVSSILYFGTIPNIAFSFLFLVYIFDPGVWSFLPSILQPNNMTTDFLIALFFAVIWLNLGPFLIWYYDERVMPIFFKDLTNLVQNQDNIDEISNDYVSLFSDQYWIPTVIWTLLLVGLFFNTQSFLVNQGLFEVGDFYYFAYLMAVIWLGIMTGIGFMGVLTTILAIRKISQENLDINPYHPDGLGGLGIFGYYAIRTTLTFSTGSLLLPLAFIFIRAGASDVIPYVIFVLYLGAIIFSFVYPTYKINRQAQRIRAKKLDSLRQDYETAKQQMEQVGRITNQLGERKSGEKIQTEIESERELPSVTELVGQLELQRIRTEYDDYKNVRLYPFQVDILIKLFSSILLPIVFVFIDHYMGILL